MSSRRAQLAGWYSLPRGRFTQIDWSAPRAMDGSDPYLAWAETAGFEGFRPALGAKDPEWLPLLIELAPGTTIDELLKASSTSWLQIPKAYQALPGMRFCTARAKQKFFDHVHPGKRLANLVQRYELGLPVGQYAQALKDPAKPGSAAQLPERRLTGKVLAVIDNGLALGHQDFLDRFGKTRVEAFWRQDNTQGPYGRSAATTEPKPLDPKRAGPVPNLMGYGHELTRSRIDAAIKAHSAQGRVDEDGLYRDLQMWGLQHLAHHGTHVTSLAAGPYMYANTLGSESQPPQWNERDIDEASKAKLIAVQLDWASMADTSGGALNVSILDALAYILSRCETSAKLTVNISWGTLAGPHDGTGLLEAALDHCCEISRGNLRLILPAGNAYQGRTHANKLIGSGEAVELNWCVQPDDHSQSFLELWFGDQAHPEVDVTDVHIEIKPAGCKEFLPGVVLSESKVWPNSQAPQLGVLFPQRSALGRHGACALLALAPTASDRAKATLTRAGRWVVRVVNKSERPLILDAYIERDDVVTGANTLARQSYFEGIDYDISGDIHGFIDHPDNPSPIRRSGTFNTLATGKETTSVGGIRYFRSAFDLAARYSPRTPDPDASRPERHEVTKTPGSLAISDDSVSLWGVRSAGSRSAAAVRMVGTSAATPQVTRMQFNGK